MVLTMTMGVDLSEHSIEEQMRMAENLLQKLAEELKKEGSAPEDSA